MTRREAVKAAAARVLVTQHPEQGWLANHPDLGSGSDTTRWYHSEAAAQHRASGIVATLALRLLGYRQPEAEALTRTTYGSAAERVARALAFITTQNRRIACA